MALVLNTNSYVEITDASDYFETRIDSASWDTATAATREDALVTATQIIDNNPWIGSAVSPSQALAWPRKNATYYDNRLGLSVSFSQTDIPELVKVAVYEQALHLLNNEDLLAQTTTTYESISIGNISLSDTNNDVTRISTTPSFVIKPIRPLIRRGATGVGSGWWRNN
jgi:hypothetical protein